MSIEVNNKTVNKQLLDKKSNANRSSNDVMNIFSDVVETMKDSTVQKGLACTSGIMGTSLLAGLVTKNHKVIKYSLSGLLASLGGIGLGHLDVNIDANKPIADEIPEQVEEKITYYDIDSYFGNKKIKDCAYYVDKNPKTGNNNKKLDENEIDNFKKVVKHQFKNYEYDFEIPDEEQLKDIESHYDSIASELYKPTGARRLGKDISKALYGRTRREEYSLIKDVFKKIDTYPIASDKKTLIKSLIEGYYLGDCKEGLFEQLGSEYYSSVTNDEVAKIMKIILDVSDKSIHMEEWNNLDKVYKKIIAKEKFEPFESPEFLRNSWTGNALKDADKSVITLLGIKK